MSEPEELTEVIELNLTRTELCTYALLAHEADITLNEWFMRAVMARLEQEKEDE